MPDFLTAMSVIRISFPADISIVNLDEFTISALKSSEYAVPLT